MMMYYNLQYWKMANDVCLLSAWCARAMCVEIDSDAVWRSKRKTPIEKIHDYSQRYYYYCCCYYFSIVSLCIGSH